MKNLNKLFIGRLGRLNYFFGTLIISGVVMIVFMLHPSDLISFALSLFTLPLAVRRLHDINLPGYFALFGWVGLLGSFGIIIAVIFNLFLLFKGGTKGANKFGKAPDPEIKFADAVLNK